MSEAKSHAALWGHSQKVHGGTPVKGALILLQMWAQPCDPVQPPGWPPLYLRPHRTRDRTGGKTRASAPRQSEHSFRVAHLQVLQSLALDHMATCLSLVWDKWTNVIPNSLGAVGALNLCPSPC